MKPFNAYKILFSYVPYSGKVYQYGGGEVWRINWLFSSIWRINRSANNLLTESTNLNGFSLANHGRFAKLSR